MNTPIARLFVVVVVLFAVLVGFTSRWTVFDANALRDNPKNRRELLEEQQIRRGLIRAGDGTVLARSLKQRRRAATCAPIRRAGCSATRWATLRAPGPRRPRALLQRRPDRAGRTSSARSSTAVGPEQEGDDLRHHARPGARSASRCSSSAGRKGAVVALDPRTGAVKVMASVPGYDPNTVKDQRQFSALNRDQDAPLLNRTTQAGYPPGSTFKVVTAIAAHRLGQVHARLAHQRAQRQDDLGRAAQQRRRRVLRRHHAHRRADQLGQHRVRRGRREARQGDDAEVHGPPRLRRSPSRSTYPRDERAASGERVQRRARSRPPTAPSTSGAWPSARTSSRSRRCRWRWSPRRWPTAASS